MSASFVVPTRYRVIHRTDYRYGAPVASGQTIAHLLVRETPHQHVVSADVEVVPVPDHRHTHIDGFGNLVIHQVPIGEFDGPHPFFGPDGKLL